MTKTKKRVLIGAATVAGLLVAYVIEERVRGGMALRAWEAKMRAAGERLTVAEVMTPTPTNPAVRILTPSQAAGFLSAATAPKDAPSTLVVVTPGRVRCVSRLDSWRDGEDRIVSWADLTPQLATCREALPQFRADLTNRAFFVKLNYDDGFELLLPHLSRHKSLAQALSAVTLLALHEGKMAEAAENLVSFPMLVETCQRERLLIGDLVAMAVGHIGMGATWEALHHDGWTDDQLAAIQRGWQAAKYLQPMSRVLEMERAVGTIYFDRSRYSARDILQLVGDMSGSPAYSPGSSSGGAWWTEWLQPIAYLGEQARYWAGLGMWAMAWREHDQLRHHQIIQTWVAETREAANSRHFTHVRTNKLDRYILPLVDETPDGPGAMRYWLSRMLTPALASAATKAAGGDALNELVVTACALKRYRLRHGQWPETLESLVPEFLPEMPRDWYSGGPLRYARRDAGTFLLYSVGADGKDDGGDARPADESQTLAVVRGRDLVWPVAASTEEIAAKPKRMPVRMPVK